MRLYISAEDVRTGDMLCTSYAEMRVFDAYETRRGTVALLVESPWGTREFRHRRATKVLIERPERQP